MRERGRRNRLLGGLLLGGLASCGPADVAGPDPPAEAELVVMTFNIFHDGESPPDAWNIPAWSERRAGVIRTIAEAGPDVVGLQEAYAWQVEEALLPALPGYRSVGRGVRADGSGHTVAILYRADRFQLEGSGHFWLSDTPDVAGSVGGSDWGAMDQPRMATWVALRSEPEGRLVYVYNTHLASDDGGGEASRARSAPLLAERIARRRDPDAPFLLIGDFNAEEDEFAVRYLLHEVPGCAGSACVDPSLAPVTLLDTWRALHAVEQGTRCRNAENGLRDTAPTDRVDYVFAGVPPAGAAWAAPVVLASNVVLPDDACVSDHLPVVSRLSLPGSP